jgi:hypothetical protein
LEGGRERAHQEGRKNLERRKKQGIVKKLIFLEKS